MLTTDRVGLYIKPRTRNRLNWFKAKLTLESGKVTGQDEAINHLLDIVNAPIAEQDTTHEPQPDLATA